MSDIASLDYRITMPKRKNRPDKHCQKAEKDNNPPEITLGEGIISREPKIVAARTVNTPHQWLLGKSHSKPCFVFNETLGLNLLSTEFYTNAYSKLGKSAVNKIVEDFIDSKEETGGPLDYVIGGLSVKSSINGKHYLCTTPDKDTSAEIIDMAEELASKIGVYPHRDYIGKRLKIGASSSKNASYAVRHHLIGQEVRGQALQLSPIQPFV